MWEIVRRSLLRGVGTDRPPAARPEDVPLAARDPAGEIELLGQALRVEIHRLFRRSLRLRHVDAGSCNGCEYELEALLGPFYDVRRFGVDFVTSPRHADALIVTGPTTRHLERALRLAEEATPRPRLVIALGDCACHGGFCAGSFATLGGVHQAVPVDVRISGCPPTPHEVLRGLLAVMGKLDRVPEDAGL